MTTQLCKGPHRRPVRYQQPSDEEFSTVRQVIIYYKYLFRIS